MSTPARYPRSPSENKADFKVPPKQRVAIPIVNPAILVNGVAKPQHTTLQTSSKPVIEKTALKDTVPKSNSPLITDNQEIQQSSSREASVQPRSKTNEAPFIGRTATQIQSSNLDVYSPNYIPLWLRAVNDCHADVQQCSSFPTIDFTSYISSLTGSDFANPLRPVVPPTPIYAELSEHELSLKSYTRFWLQRLQNEFALQSLQYQSFALYNRGLVPTGREGLFELSIPGLRENTPRIDLGDTIHVRPLLPPTRHIDSQVMHWLKVGRYQGSLCPGFTGLLYNCQVWELDRAKEKATLRIDGMSNNFATCNVVFLLQESKVEPICRSVQAIPFCAKWLRRMLFPEVKQGVLQKTLSQAHFNVPWVDDLNWEQKKAVHTVLSANYGTMPYLIWGPPGTGKTKTLVETALQLLYKPGHLLICAPSDAAADTLALRLSTHLQPHELFRLNGWTRTFAEVPDRLLLYTRSEGPSFSLPPIQEMLSFRIVVTTCRDADLLNRARLSNTALSNLFNGVRRVLMPDSPRHPLHWTALLLDEAAQATEPDALIPLTVVAPPDDEEYPQFVAAGDQYQLGPKLLSESELRVSLFQRLFDCEPYSDHPLSRKHGIKALTSAMLPMMRPTFTNLIRNYRSHPAILSVPSSLFYNDTLITERKTSEAVLSWPGWPSPEQWPVLFQQNDTPDAYESVLEGDGTGAGTLYNPGEASAALELTLSLLRHHNKDNTTSTTTNPILTQKEIMIMTPFKAQVSYLRKLFRHHNLFDVNIGPLEAFQGLESRIVIICTTRTRLGSHPTKKPNHFVTIDSNRGLGVIDEPQRLNVAMTRAQEGLLVLGNAHCLVSTRDEQWTMFLDFCRRNDCFTTPSEGFEWPDLGGPYRQGRLERALRYAAVGRARADLELSSNDKRSRRHAVASSISSSSSLSVTRCVSGSRISTARKPRFKLQGPRQNLDEEMWQFKELAQLHDSENVDIVLEGTSQDDVDDNNDDDDDDDGHDDGHDHESTKAQQDNTESNETYDRNLTQEFHRECTIQ